MPNIPPMGAYGAPAGPSPGAATAVVDAVATLVGETTPRLVLEIWAAAADGVPKLVWVRSGAGPTSVAVSYVSASPPAGGHVHVTWVPLNPLKSDSYDVRRPDGSLVATVGQSVTVLDDPSPLPLNGGYSVSSKLGGLLGQSVASSALNLATAPTSFAAVLWSAPTPHPYISWQPPAWGTPHQYQLWRDGVLFVTLPGTTLAYDDFAFVPGAVHAYQVFAVLSGVKGGGTSVINVSNPPNAPANVSLSTPVGDTLRLYFETGGGTVTNFEVQRYHDPATAWVAFTTLPYATSYNVDWVPQGSGGLPDGASGYMRVRANAPGGSSAWVQVGPVTPMVPPAVVSLFRDGARNINLQVDRVGSADRTDFQVYRDGAWQGWNYAWPTDPFNYVFTSNTTPAYAQVVTWRGSQQGAVIQYGPTS